MIYWQIFISFFKVGLFSFGGGYAALPLIEEEIIQGREWITNQEFIDVLTMSEMTPGSIAINAATFVGNNVLGIPGAVIATTGVVAPSIIVVLLLASFYYKYQNLQVIQGIIQGLRPAVVALLASAGSTILLTSLFGSNHLPIQFENFNFLSFLLIGFCLWLFRKTELGPIHVILLSGAIGVVVFSF